MPKLLNAAQIGTQNRKGYHLPGHLLLQEEVAACRSQLEAYEKIRIRRNVPVGSMLSKKGLREAANSDSGG